MAVMVSRVHDALHIPMASMPRIPAHQGDMLPPRSVHKKRKQISPKNEIFQDLIFSFPDTLIQMLGEFVSQRLWATSVVPLLCLPPGRHTVVRLTASTIRGTSKVHLASRLTLHSLVTALTWRQNKSNSNSSTNCTDFVSHDSWSGLN